MLGRWGSKVKDRWILCTIGVLCLALLVLQALGIPNKPDFERSLNAVVAIEHKGQMIGAGFFYSPDGCILTAHHVIDEIPPKDLTVSLHQTMKKFKAKVVYKLPYIDAAILCMPNILYAPSWIPIRTSENVHPGDTLYTIGHPGGPNGSLKWSITDGILSKYAYLKRLRIRTYPITVTMGGKSKKMNLKVPYWYPQYVMYVNMDVLPGNSGGPLLDENGYAVGMVVGFFGAGPMHPVGISRAIPGTDLVRMTHDAREK